MHENMVRIKTVARGKDLIDTSDFEEGVYAHVETGAYGGNPQTILEPLKKAIGL